MNGIENISTVREFEYRTLFEQAAVGVAKVAPDGTYLDLNNKLCEIVGYNKEELLKMSFKDITHPDDLEADLEKIQQVLDEVIQTYSIEKRYLRKNGEIVWINLNVSLVRDENRSPLYFISVVSDISRTKIAEQQLKAINQQMRANEQQLRAANRQLQQSEKKFRKLFENSPFGIIINQIERDEAGNPINFIHQQANQVTSVQLGMELSDLIGTRATDIADAETASKFIKKYGKVVDSGDPISFDYYFNHHEKTLWVTAFHLLDDIFITTFSDISERKKAEDELSSAYQQLQAKEQQLRAANQQLIALNQQLSASERALIENESQLKSALEISRTGRWRWDLETNEIFIDDRTHEILGYRKGDIGTHVEDLYKIHHPVDLKVLMKKIEDYISGKTLNHYTEHRMIQKDGSWVWVSGRGEITEWKDGKPKVFSGTIMDINENKQLQERLDLTVKGSNDAPWDMDLISNDVWCSDQFAQQIGYEQEELDFNTGIFSKLIHPDDSERINESYTEALRSKERYQHEYRLKHKDGHYVPILERGIVTRDEKGTAIRVTGTNMDLTKIKETEQALKDSKERIEKLSSIVEQSIDAMFLGDLEGNLTFINQAGMDMMRVKDRSLVKTIPDVHPVSSHKQMNDALETLLSGKEWKGILQFKNFETGGSIDTDFYSIPIKDENGNIIALAAIARDITEKLEAEEEIKKSKEEIEFFMDLLGHDLGNIHQGVAGSLQLLQKRLDDDSSVHRILDLAYESVYNATSLTKEVILLSRLRDKTPDMVDLDLGSIIDESIYQIKAAFPGVEVDLEIDLVDEKIRAEPIVKELFINLLHNAIRLQGGKPWIGIGSKIIDDQVSISISDNGPGIPYSMKPELFKRFGHKGEKIRRGLGLSIAKVLVERYGGEISVEDRVEGDHTKGARFIVLLPRS